MDLLPLFTRGLLVACCSAVAASAAGASSGAARIESRSDAPAVVGTARAPAPARASARRPWYVDPSATGANNGRSWANAWTSFASISWASVKPGDTVYLSGGARSRTYTGMMNVDASGTPRRPITIAAGSETGHNGTVVFDYKGLGSSATATGIRLRGNYLTLSGNVGGTNHLEVDNLVNTSSGTSSAGVSCAGHNGIRVDHVTFANDNNPVRCTSTRRVTISNSRFLKVRGDAAIAMAGSKGGFDSSIVSGNYIETVAQQGTGAGPDGVQNGSGVTIVNNQFKEIVLRITTSDQHPDMIQNQGDNTKVYGNTFTNMGDSNFDFDTFADAAPHHIYIYNNVFRIVETIDPYPDFIRFYHSAGPAPRSITNFVVANNVFADSTQGSGVPPVNICYYDSCGSPTTRGNRITNNIFVNDGSGGSSGPMLYLSSNAGSNWTASHNVYHRSRGGYVAWKGSRYTAASFVARVDRNGSISLPSFVSYSLHAASNDFHLRASDKVAVDRGTSVASLFAVDKDGFARPQRRAWDIGAYEWHVAAPCRVPKVVGKPLAQAKRKIAEAHCRVGSVTKRPSSMRKKGNVLAQRPRPGKKLKSGARVILTVGKGR